MPREYAMVGPIAVYRMFSAAGRLLYIGQTVNPAQRLCLHRNDAEKNWLTEVVRMEIQWLPTREAAKATEAAAIRAECPIYNVDHQTDQTDRRRAKRAIRGHYLFGKQGVAQ